MKTAFTLVLGILLAVGQPATVYAADIPPALQKIVKYTGTFKGTGVLSTPDGKKQTVKVTHENKQAADGMALIGMEKVETTPTYRCVNLFGYDKGGDAVHLFSVSSSGETQDHKGKWSDENTLELEYRGKDPETGGSYVESLIITFEGPSSYSYVSRVAVDGKEKSVFEARVKK